MKEKILLLGLDPSVVNYSSFPGLTMEKLERSLKAQENSLRELGFDAHWCLLDEGKTAEAVVKSALRGKDYDVVLIGAGVRTMPAHFLLFEKLINIVHQYAPGAKLCFNTNPDDTQEAVLRWVTEPAATP